MERSLRGALSFIQKHSVHHRTGASLDVSVARARLLPHVSSVPVRQLPLGMMYREMSSARDHSAYRTAKPQVNLGRFQLATTTAAPTALRLGPGVESLYEKMTLHGSDTGLFVARVDPSRFSWDRVAFRHTDSGTRDRHASTTGDVAGDAGSATQETRPVAAGGGDPIVAEPVLQDFRMHVAVAVLPVVVPGAVSVKAHVEAESLALRVGPSAVEALMRVLTDMTTTTVRPRWLEDTTLAGRVKVLQRAGYMSGVTRWEVRNDELEGYRGGVGRGVIRSDAVTCGKKLFTC